MIKPGCCQTKLHCRLYVVLRKLLSFSSAQEALSMGLVQMTLYAIGCFSSLPCRHGVKPAISAPGGIASLVIGSRKTC